MSAFQRTMGSVQSINLKSLSISRYRLRYWTFDIIIPSLFKRVKYGEVSCTCFVPNLDRDFCSVHNTHIKSFCFDCEQNKIIFIFGVHPTKGTPFHGKPKHSWYH